MLVLTIVAGGGTAGNLANARRVSISKSPPLPPDRLCAACCCNNGVRNVLIPEFDRTGSKVTSGGAFVVTCLRNRSAYKVSGSSTTSTSALPNTDTASEDISNAGLSRSGSEIIMGTTFSSPVGSKANIGGMMLSVTVAMVGGAEVVVVVVVSTGLAASVVVVGFGRLLVVVVVVVVGLVVTGLETILPAAAAVGFLEAGLAVLVRRDVAVARTFGVVVVVVFVSTTRFDDRVDSWDAVPVAAGDGG